MKWKSTIYLQIIILGNLFPIFCILQYHWSFFLVLWLYWLESLIIAIFNVAQILASQKNELGISKAAFRSYKISLAFKHFMTKVFILIFYLLFMITFIGFQNIEKDTLSITYKTIFFKNPIFNYALLTYFVTSYYYYIFYFMANKKYIISNPLDSYNWFDARTIVLHVVIILGVFANQYFGKTGLRSSEIFLIVYIIIKTIAELVIYNLFNNDKELETTPYI